MAYDFYERLKISMESLQLETDRKTLENYFPDVRSVRKSDIEDDKSGIDYIVTLQSGVEIGVDVKTRDKGCGKFWRNGPELALETWSQKWPKYSQRGNVVGWTVDSTKKCQYIMFKFDRADSETVYIMPFQQLNKAFRRNMRTWYRAFKHDEQRQRTAAYVSECIFVPANIVIDAVTAEFATGLARW